MNFLCSQIKTTKHKIVQGAVLILLLFVLVFISPAVIALATSQYSDMRVTPVLSSNAVSTSDAKFVNNHIITGVNGKLTVLSLDRSTIASFSEVTSN